MPTRFAILPYKSASASARMIRNGLPNCVKLSSGSPRLQKLMSVTGVFDTPNVFINWGCPHNTDTYPQTKQNTLMVNVRGNSEDYNNKLNFFLKFRDTQTYVYLPPTYTDYQRAQEFLNSQPSLDSEVLLVERQNLTGSGGQGIRFLRSGDVANPSSRLWTRYIKKSKEYRVHFAFGRVIAVQVKLIPREAVEDARNENRNDIFLLRNYDNGWRYSIIPETGDVASPPERVLSAANSFISNPSNTLDFGALDIIYNTNRNEAYILEVNRAPGVGEALAPRYVEAFRTYANNYDFDRRT